MSEPKVYRRQNREDVNEQSDNTKIVYLPVDAIRPNRSQPRNRFDTNTMIRLADSVRRYGILQPLTVRHIEICDFSAETNGNLPLYELIAGERRLRAAKLAGLVQVPCIITCADDHLSAELAMIENLLREDLNMFEQARAFGRLIVKFSITQEQVARRMSMSQSAVANKLRLLKFYEKEQQAILTGGLTERHARAILRLPPNEERFRAISTVVERKMNVAATEAYVENLINNAAFRELPREKAVLEEKSEVMGRKKFVLKDLRIFYNSIEHAADILKQTGLRLQIEQKEEQGRVLICISVENPPVEETCTDEDGVSRETLHIASV